jgi:hypothetical protein
VRWLSASRDSSFPTCSLILRSSLNYTRVFNSCPVFAALRACSQRPWLVFLGYFHHKLVQGAAAAIAGLSLPYFSTWFWFRVTNPTSSAGLLQLFGPSVIAAIGTFFALFPWHARLSNFGVDILTEQMVSDECGKPKAQWEKMTYRVCMVIGTVAVVTLMFLGMVGRGR